MPTVYEDIEVRDKGSAILDQITKRLGLFNKEGLAMGISFALVNKGAELAMQGIRYFVDILKTGIESSRELQSNLVYATNTIDDMDISVNQLKNDLAKMSTTFGEDINVLAKNLQMFTRQNYSASESVRLLNQSEMFAKATGEDFAATVDAMNTAMEVFDLTNKDSTYILTHFNELVDETQLSVSDIGNAFARASPEIRKSGLSLDDLVNILYTLEQRGDAPRTMLGEINDVLKDISKQKIDLLPESEVKSIDEKYSAVEKTNKAFWDRFGADVAEGGRQTVDAIGKTVDFYVTAYDNWGKKLRGLFGIKEKTELPKVSLFPEVTGPKENPFVSWANDIKASVREVKGLQAELKIVNDVAAKYFQEIGDLTAQRGFTVALHDASEAVQEQEDRIKSLQRVSDQYSFSMRSNELEIMKIEYSAMVTRRGRLTREAKQKIQDLEKTNAFLRINETEQQIEIESIQLNGLQSALDKQESIKREYSEWSYETEIRDLDAIIKEKNELYMAQLPVIADLNTQIATVNQAFYDADLNSFTAYMRRKKEIGNTLNQNAPVTTPPQTYYQWKMQGYQFGGPVMETGLALVHRGEYVVPKSGATAGAPSKTNVNINIDLTIKNQDNAEHLAMKIGQLIAQGYLKGVDCVYHLGG